MSPRFAYFYLMASEPERARVTVPPRVAHWRSLGLTGYLGGPFADPTGGLIVVDSSKFERPFGWGTTPLQ